MYNIHEVIPLNHNKSKIRKQIIDRLKRKDILDKCEEELKIYKTLFNINDWKGAKNIGITISMGHEINTYPIIRQALMENKQIFAPISNYQNKTMNFQPYDGSYNFNVDQKGIPYPYETIYEEIELDLLIVPGVLFDQNGFRMGYGGGFFDRYISRYNHLNTIALAFNEQIGDVIVEPHDQKLSKIITAKDVIEVK